MTNQGQLSTIKGTRNLLQDLLSCSVSLKKINFSKNNLSEPVLEEEKVHCSVCFSDGEKVEPIKEAEVDILKEVVFKSWTNVTPTPPGGLGFNWICTHCSATLARLAKCRQEIEDIVTCLQSVMRIKMATGQRSNLIPSSNVAVVAIDTDDKNKSDMEEDGVETFNPQFPTSSSSSSTTSERSNKAQECVSLALEDIQQGDEGDSQSEKVKGDNSENITNASHIIIGDSDHTGIGSAKEKLQPVKVKVGRKRKIQSQNDKPTCDKCGKIFSCLDSLRRHQKNEGIHKRLAKKAGGGDGVDLLLKCHICLIKFAHEYSRNRHLLSMLHSQGLKSRRINPDGSITFSCDQCKRDFNRLRALRDHKVNDHPKNLKKRPFVCPLLLCGRRFLTSVDLRRHAKTHTNTEVEKGYQFPESLKRFMRNGRLLKHKKRHPNIDTTCDQDADIQDNQRTGVETSNPRFVRSSSSTRGRTKDADIEDNQRTGVEMSNHQFVRSPSSTRDRTKDADIQDNQRTGVETSNHQFVRSPSSTRDRTKDSDTQDNQRTEVETPNSQFVRSSSSTRDRTKAQEFFTLGFDLILGNARHEKAKSDGDNSERTTPGQIVQDGNDKGPINMRVEILHPMEPEIDNERVVRGRDLRTGDKPTCNICGKTYRDLTDLKRHQDTKIHRQKSLKTCDICLIEYANEYSRNRHLLSMLHSQGLKSRRINQNGKVAFTCDKCQQNFNRLKALCAHKLYDHAKKHKKRPFVCPLLFCGKRFLRSLELQRHGITHANTDVENDIQTSLIQVPLNTEFGTTDDKDKLENKSRKTKKQHRCHIPGCGKVYSCPSTLRYHLIYHAGERPFVCQWPLCGKRFARCDELKRHGRSHTGERPFMCQWLGCGQRFTRSDHLQSHRITHTGEKRFQCPECPAKFGRKVQLSKHIKTHSRSRITTDGNQSHSFIVDGTLLNPAVLMEFDITDDEDTPENPGTDSTPIDTQQCSDIGTNDNDVDINDNDNQVTGEECLPSSSTTCGRTKAQECVAVGLGHAIYANGIDTNNRVEEVQGVSDNDSGIDTNNQVEEVQGVSDNDSEIDTNNRVEEVQGVSDNGSEIDTNNRVEEVQGVSDNGSEIDTNNPVEEVQGVSDNGSKIDTTNRDDTAIGSVNLPVEIVPMDPVEKEVDNTRITSNGDKPTCDVCGTLYSSHFHLKRHQKSKIHKQKSQKAAVKSGRLYKNGKCDICLLEFSNINSLNRHFLSNLHWQGIETRRINLDGSIVFACDKCERDFHRLRALCDHQSYDHAQHGRKRRFLCRWLACGKRFLRSSELQRHKTTHINTPREKLQCPECPKKFMWNKSLFMHIKRHSSNRRAASDVVKDDDLKPVVPNMKFDIPEEEDGLENVEDITSQQRRSDEDFIRTQYVIEFAKLNDGERTQHIVETVTVPLIVTGLGDLENIGAVPFEQDLIDSTNWQLYDRSPLVIPSSFGTEGTVTVIKTAIDKSKTKQRKARCSCPNCTNSNARKNSENKHLCHIPGCGKVFSRTSGLRDHLKWHAGEKPFACDWPLCGKRFIRSADLQIHHRTHTGEKPFICQWLHCGRRFTRSDVLARHRRIHTTAESHSHNDNEDDRNLNLVALDMGKDITKDKDKLEDEIHKTKNQHLCHICGKVYNWPGALHDHLNCHARKKQCVCRWPQCGKRFTNFGTLKRHRRSHTGERCFQCTQCLKRFSRKDHLTRHIGIHSKNKSPTDADGSQPNCFIDFVVDDSDLKPVVVNMEFDIANEDSSENVDTNLAYADGEISSGNETR